MKLAELNDIWELIGEEAVLIPVRKETKRPTIKGWEKLTSESRNDPKIEKHLLREGNVGVLLGHASGGLCTIDIDHDDEVEGFLELNPRLKETLQTRGGRGLNLWLRVIGQSPKLTPLEKNAEQWGEWRGNGGQTVIQGVHPTKKPYTYVQKAPPIEISFNDIIWPEGVTFGAKKRKIDPLGASNGGALASASPPSSECSIFLYDSKASVPSTHSMLLYDTPAKASLALKALQARSVSELAQFSRWIRWPGGGVAG